MVKLMKKKTFKLHFSSVVENTFKSSWLILTILVFNSIEIFGEFINDNISLINVVKSLGIFFLLITILFIYFIYKWYKTTIEIDNKMITITQNTIQKKIQTTLIKNISSINIEQNIFERILNTAKIKFDTNSIEANNNKDINIILKKDFALKIQLDLLNLIENKEKTKDIDKDNTNLITFKYSKMIKHILLNMNIFIFAFLFTSYFFLIKSTNLEGNFIFPLIFIVVPLLFSFISNLGKYYGFSLKKDNDKIIMNYGYFTKKKINIPYNKINGLKIKQSLFARLLKRYSLEIICIGMSEADNESIPVLLPYMKKEELHKYINLLLPEYNLNVEYINQNKKSIIVIIFSYFIFIILSIIISYFYNLYILIIVIIAWLFIIILKYKTCKFRYLNNTVYLITGIFNKNLIITKLNKIEHISIMKNFISSKLGLSKINIYILASSLNITHQSGYFKEDKLDELIDKYK